MSYITGKGIATLALPLADDAVTADTNVPVELIAVPKSVVLGVFVGVVMGVVVVGVVVEGETVIVWSTGVAAL